MKRDDYILDLFRKRCTHINNEDKLDLEDEDHSLDKLFLNTDDDIPITRKDIFFAKKIGEENDEMEDFGGVIPKKVDLSKFFKISSSVAGNALEKRSDFDNQFKVLFNSQDLSDITLLANDRDGKEQKIFCHKFILQSRCAYFKEELKDANVFKIENIEHEVLMVLIEFLYTGVLKIVYKNALLVLAGANQLMMDDAKDLVAEYFKGEINPENACMLYEESFYHSAKKLRNICLSFIENDSNSIVFSKAFKEMGPEMIIDIISSDFLAVDEVELFKGLIEWSKAQVELYKEEKKTFKDYLSKVISHVRFGLIPAKTLRDVIEKQYGDLVPQEILIDAYRYHLGFKGTTRPRLSVADFQWDYSKKSTYINMSNLQKTVTSNYSSNISASTVSKQVFDTGLYYWEVKIEKTNDSSSNIQIGVSDRSSCTVEGYFANNRRGYCICGNGNVSNNNIKKSYAPRLKSGDVVGVLLNLSDGEISFFVNGKNHGVAYREMKGPLSPGVAVYHNIDKLTLQTNCKPPLSSLKKKK